MRSLFSHHPLTVAALSLACAALAPTAHAGHSWNGYHWASSGAEFTLKLGDNVTSAWDPYLVTSRIDWSASGDLDTVIVPGAAGGGARKCRPNSGRVEICNSAYGRNGWLGVAQIWISGSHITAGVVKMNDSYFASGSYNTPAWRNLVMCQEIGHTFGLDHQDEIFTNPNLGTCMDYTNFPADNQHPNNHDYQMLGTIYGHDDGTSTVNQSAQLPAALGEVEVSEPHQWGKLVKKSRTGKHEAYARDLGDGYQVHTFVIWTDEKGDKKKD